MKNNSKKLRSKKINFANYKFSNFSSKFESLIGKLEENFFSIRAVLSKKYKTTIFYKKTNPYTRVVKRQLTKYSMFYILAVVLLIFVTWTASTPGIQNVLSPPTFIVLLRNNAQFFLLALPMLWVIISGNIDLSVGAMYGLIAFVSIRTFNASGQNLFVALVLALFIGLAIGAVTGFLVGYLKIPGFIATLGGSLLFQGLLVLLADGQSIAGTQVEGGISALQKFALLQIDVNVASERQPFHIIAFLIFILVGVLIISMNVSGVIRARKIGLNRSFSPSFFVKQVIFISFFLALGILIALSNGGLQLFILYILIIVSLFFFISTNTKFGRAIYAVGGNKKAAALSGVNVNATIFKIFLIMGLVGGFSGFLYAAINNAASPALGVGEELTVISSVFVGGASVAGGIGTVVGTVIITFIQQGLIILAQPVSYINIIRAVVLLSVVAYDTLARRKVR